MLMDGGSIDRLSGSLDIMARMGLLEKLDGPGEWPTCRSCLHVLTSRFFAMYATMACIAGPGAATTCTRISKSYCWCCQQCGHRFGLLCSVMFSTSGTRPPVTYAIEMVQLCNGSLLVSSNLQLLPVQAQATFPPALCSRPAPLRCWSCLLRRPRKVRRSAHHQTPAGECLYTGIAHAVTCVFSKGFLGYISAV